MSRHVEMIKEGETVCYMTAAYLRVVVKVGAAISTTLATANYEFTRWNFQRFLGTNHSSTVSHMRKSDGYSLFS